MWLMSASSRWDRSRAEENRMQINDGLSTISSNVRKGIDEMTREVYGTQMFQSADKPQFHSFWCGRNVWCQRYYTPTVLRFRVRFNHHSSGACEIWILNFKGPPKPPNYNVCCIGVSDIVRTPVGLYSPFCIYIRTSFINQIKLCRFIFWIDE